MLNKYRVGGVYTFTHTASFLSGSESLRSLWAQRRHQSPLGSSSVREGGSGRVGVVYFFVVVVVVVVVVNDMRITVGNVYSGKPVITSKV